MKRFRIAFSFAGEKRDFVALVAAILAKKFGEGKILYDKYHEAEFARYDLGIHLPKFYRDESDLVVAVIYPNYDEKLWTGWEWRAIYSQLSNKEGRDIMLFRFGYAQVDGLSDAAAFVELDDKTPEQAATLILERLALNEGNPKDHYTKSAAAAAVEKYRMLAQLREFTLYDPVDRLLESAAAFAAFQSTPVTPEAVLTTIAVNGSVEREPQWVCDIFRRAIERGVAVGFLDDARLKYFELPDVRKSSGSGRDAHQPVHRDLYDAFVAAREIARRASNTERIHTRHLLAALIAADSQRTDSPSLLDRFGVDHHRLGEELFRFITFDLAENRTEWEHQLLGYTGPDRRLFDFHADSPGDRDLLGIDRDVTAFATLIAARDVNPPLSVGLFGDWGSGKSFFMRQLRKAIDLLAREARASEQMQCDWPFYKRIMQVEFNAWHYVDGNLWASLVQHILDNLRPTGDKSTSRQLQQHLLKELKFASTTEVEARAAVVAAASAVADTEQSLARAEQALETKSRELERLAAEDVTTSFVLSDVAALAKKAMEELRIEPAGASAGELAKALSGAKAVLTGSSRVLTPLQRSKDRGQRRLTLALSIGLIPATVWLVRRYLIARGVDLSSLGAEITAIGTAVVGPLSAVTVWLRKQTVWLDARRKEVATVQQQYDDRVAELRSAHSDRVAKLRDAMQKQANDFADAKQKHETAKQRVAAAEAELDDATSGRLLARFVEDRAGSTDYRKHLGVLAVVRRDFESLSNLIEEENWRLLPSNGEDETDRIKPKFTSLTDERKDENVRINRIVLYIDDLDRCPPTKVVDVLQAVHLLLAFPLFVVVVGVDARWIARSLETKYRELLLTQGPNSGDRFEEVFGRATTNDYLEKIFQVPFWIRPMDPTVSAQMIRGLLERSVSSDAARSSTAPMATPDLAAPGITTVSAETVASLTAVPGMPGESAEGGHIGQNGANRAKAKQQLASLVIHDAEMQLITRLTPLLGRSPRALKRFVNVYRLLKAGLTSAEQDQFHRAGVSNSWAVLFLLAVDTGAPLAAHAVFDAVSQVALTDGSTLDQLQIHLNQRIALENEGNKRTPDWTDDWIRVDRWLTGQSEARSSPAIMDALSAWAPRVARYSFHAVRDKLG